MWRKLWESPISSCWAFSCSFYAHPFIHLSLLHFVCDFFISFYLFHSCSTCFVVPVFITSFVILHLNQCECASCKQPLLSFFFLTLCLWLSSVSSTIVHFFHFRPVFGWCKCDIYNSIAATLIVQVGSILYNLFPLIPHKDHQSTCIF